MRVDALSMNLFCLVKRGSQVCFHFFSLIFNRKVKNNVENAFVTKVTIRKPASFYCLHWIECEAESRKNFCSGADLNCTIGQTETEGSPADLMLMKTRVDKLMVERGLVPSRERAQALLLAGRVLVDGQKVEKAGTNVEHDAELRLLGEDLRYVSRGGLKLEAALQYWEIDLHQRTCLDVGASTGGFTDCMLQHDAAQVIAVDTGYGQISLRLRNDGRVKLLENTNARYLDREQLYNTGAQLPVTFIAVDVSFISVTLILPSVLQAAFTEPDVKGRAMVVLVKPQFEVGRERVAKGGIVRDEQAQMGAIDKVRDSVEKLGGRKLDVIESPILGGEGNREFLLHAEF